MMCSDKVRYYRVGGMIYIFYLAKRVAQVYGFIKPYHKRRKIRDPWLFHSSRHFYLFYEISIVEDPEKYLEITKIEEWRELILGVSYL